MVDKQGQVWLVDFDRAEAAASQAPPDRDAATLLAAPMVWPTRRCLELPHHRPSNRQPTYRQGTNRAGSNSHRPNRDRPDASRCQLHHGSLLPTLAKQGAGSGDRRRLFMPGSSSTAQGSLGTMIHMAT
jgi:hypothetical protein